MKDDLPTIAAKAGPGLIVSAWQAINTGLPTIILWATAIYTIAQAYLALRKVYADWKAGRE